MDTKEKIKQLCASRGTNVKQLEIALGFGNGSLMKTTNFKENRLKAIADYFNVPMSYFLGDDDDWSEYRETLATSPETRMLLDIVKGADAETLIQLTKIAEALRNG